ncbi:protein-glutamate methylesterase/protein-glutamine glutaminase [Asticcacaulis benevestitus]|uniref:Protein-glutamate methylesterase/protein-glutamine glutaminase n=1 Tax=Asticcacaulis benevestitus DSM 16100 = ATCC BAA-896 TaxID=1121022 RepID=V4Q4P4_9CAUL|nr:chemotaxis response regulator protein-glutamate methylesterase [Asticcacaulis benevestitus]ESQ92810.1 hypothetical protein ABENE_06830 [Asticcacaulis benevestitus DSM 16100 = ATCC BAA-896]
MIRPEYTRPIKVLVVDDSALMRQMLTTVLSSDPGIVVVDTASDPLIARDKIKRCAPDVITLDIEMPRMNGLEFLRRIMTLHPMPVIMISSLTQAGTDVTLKALEMGAVDFIGKPLGFITDGMEAMRDDIIAKVKAAALSRVRVRQAPNPPKSIPLPAASFSGRVIAIGASTGGIPAIASILQDMPSNAPPIVITQHLPEIFTARFAERLNTQCAISVTEAQDGEPLLMGHAYIAPGGQMMRLAKARQGVVINITQEPKVNGFCPSVDVMFDSVAETFGPRAVGALLTGMGQDGARGLMRMCQAGAVTIGQDAESCVVYGMPRAAYEMGAVTHQLPLSRIPSMLLTLCTKPSNAGDICHVLT